jgi:hypothetical protein
MLKKYLIVVAMLGGLGFSMPSWSLMINSIEVGSLDTIKGVIVDLNKDPGGCGTGSDPAIEECWAESVLGIDITYSDKEDPVDVMYNVDKTIAAFELQTGPGYYIVKNARIWVLMENELSIDYGVLDLSALSAVLSSSKYSINLGGDDQFTISHVTEFDGSRDIPEPSILALLGAGLLGLGFTLRRKIS